MSVNSSISIPALRNGLLAGLLVTVVVLTLGVTVLVRAIFENFGPAVQADLEWKVARGARELAKVTDLGLAVGDGDMVAENFTDYKASEDVVAIVAQGADGTVLADYGTAPWPTEALFAESPGVVVQSPQYLIAWFPSEIEGAPVGRVALVVSKRRLIDSKVFLQRIELGTFVGGGATMLVGLLVLGFFSHLVIQRDKQLADYAANLENKVAERTAELDKRNKGMRLVLDNVSQGFITVGLDGAMEAERSAIVDTWFEGADAGVKLQALFAAGGDDRASQWFELGLDQIADAFMPVECLIGQLPEQVSLGSRTLHADYIPIMEGETEDVAKLLVVLSDITEKLEREKAEAEQREVMELFQRITKDKTGFIDFLKDARGMVARIVDDLELDPVIQKRLIHTLKGNSAFFGMKTVFGVCHEVEDHLEERGGGMESEEREMIRDAWGDAEERIAALVGEEDSSVIQIDLEEYHTLRSMVEKGAPTQEVERVLRAWELDPVQKRLDQLADQARDVAKRVGKPDIQVLSQGNGVRLDAETWSPFWSAMIHAIRNSIDHGLEGPDERAESGKAGPGTVVLSSVQTGEALVVAVQDDGRGIAWEKIRSKASGAGLRSDTTHDLAEALFADGVSSRDAATETSGRGVGMSALREAVAALGGHIDVESEPGAGTRFLFRFPNVEAMTMTHDLEVEEDSALEAPVRASRRFSDVLGSAVA